MPELHPQAQVYKFGFLRLIKLCEKGEIGKVQLNGTEIEAHD